MQNYSAVIDERAAKEERPEVKKNLHFQISETQIKQYAEELVMWGQSKKLEPAELAIVLKMVHEMLAKILGLSEKGPR